MPEEKNEFKSNEGNSERVKEHLKKNFPQIKPEDAENRRKLGKRRQNIRKAADGCNLGRYGRWEQAV
jgi:hypothetical protein